MIFINHLDEQLDKTNQSLEEASVPMPAFGDVKNALAKEVGEPTESESNLAFTKSRTCKISF